MVSITKRLRDLREDNDMTQKEIAERLGIRYQVYQRYENGERKLPVDLLATLSLQYKVSADYILGLTDNPRRI